MAQVFVRTQSSLFRVCELPQETLEKVAKKYPLDPAAHESSDRNRLQVVIAIHHEIARRANGGSPIKRALSLQEVAEEIIQRGFRAVSQKYHPDKDGGDHESQILADEARKKLLVECSKFAPTLPSGSLIVDTEGVTQVADDYAHSTEITDDDIPF